MPVQPVHYALRPRPPRWARWLHSRFSRWHAVVALVLWLGFSGLTLAILLTGLKEAADRPLKVAATTAGTVLGPMTGAIARDFQSCCLESSLRLLPVCLGALAGAVLVQLIVRPRGRWRNILRLTAWATGLFAWFAGGIVSFGHALS